MVLCLLMSAHITECSVLFYMQISVGCSSTNAENFVLSLKESSAILDKFTSVFTEDNNTANQVMKSVVLVETLLNRHLEAVAFVIFANGLVKTAETISFIKFCNVVLNMISDAYVRFFLIIHVGTFDIQTANYSGSSNSEHGVCVECELVPWTEVQGCHMELDCDNVDLIE